jgi:fructose-bisphosphate aldolase, class II
MSLVNLAGILAPAYRKGTAVGAFNVINLEFLEAILGAAESRSSPVILNIAEVHFPFITPEHIVPLTLHLAGRSSVPVALNLDHGLTFEAVVRAIEMGFTSVMFDGSKLPFEENIRRTAEIVRIAHARNVSVEAELGAVGGEEGGGLVGTARPEFFTDPEQAGDFVGQTGCDALAVAIGNAHGLYRGDPRLDFARLGAIRAKTGVPLVLHGGSGIADEDLRKAISLGIAKINFFTGMSQAGIESLRASLAASGRKYNDLPLAFRDMKMAIQRTVERHIQVSSTEERSGGAQ